MSDELTRTQISLIDDEDSEIYNMMPRRLSSSSEALEGSHSFAGPVSTPRVERRNRTTLLDRLSSKDPTTWSSYADEQKSSAEHTIVEDSRKGPDVEVISDGTAVSIRRRSEKIDSLETRAGRLLVSTK
jgi:hypothetical protein